MRPYHRLAICGSAALRQWNAREIRREGILPGFAAQVGHLREAADAGVRDQDVESAVLSADVVDQRGHGGAVTDVDDDGARLSPGLADQSRSCGVAMG